MEKRDTRYIDQLTWLRGIAAFFVIVSHTFRATEVQYTGQDQASHFLPLNMLDLGSFGVVLFFVLSGATLYLSNAHKVQGIGVTGFYIKRVFRIWPAFAIALVCYMAFMPIFANYYVSPLGHWVEKQFLMSYSVSDVISYLTLTFNITGPRSLFNNAFWSLPVEFQYYLVFPLIVLSLRYLNVAGPFLFGIALYLLPRFGLVSFENDDVFLLALSFCGGVIIAYLYQATGFRLKGVTALVLLGACILGASAISQSFVRLPDLPMVSNKWNWYIGLGILAVFASLFTQARFHGAVERFLGHYGRISYSTYLFHNLFVGLSVLILIHSGITSGMGRLAFTFLFTVIGSFVVASASFKYVEAPFMRIGRQLSTSAGGQRVSTSPER